MNAVVNQTLRCLLHEMNEKKRWEICLPTVDMVINSMPNKSTGFSPFYLNYGHEPVMPIQLLRDNEKINTEIVAYFIQKVTSDWECARENLRRSVGLQQKYYDRRHKDARYKVGDLVVLSTRNIEMKRIPGKLQRRFVGPFWVIETIGQQAYRLSLPDTWKIHPLFHVSLLKDWNTVDLREDQQIV